MKYNSYKGGIVSFLLFCSVSLFAFQGQYPYPLKSFPISMERINVKMVYMDVPSQHPNGKSVILFHGKNFDGAYWRDVIPVLNDLGYRVIVPDQLGFGSSDKPNIHYSFHQMASNCRALLDSLHIDKVTVIGHSMGGMLATRFSLLFGSQVEKLVLENPIGLEDYKTFVPYTDLGTLYKQELSASYDSYKKYQQTYYPVWKPEYEWLVKEQTGALAKPDFAETAWANALTYQMIYEQPVCYEFKNIKVKTLLIIGTFDRTIVGKGRLTKKLIDEHGQYQKLGKQVHEQIKGSTLVELPGVGHIPHIQAFDSFKKSIVEFLK